MKKAQVDFCNREQTVPGNKTGPGMQAGKVGKKPVNMSIDWAGG